MPLTDLLFGLALERSGQIDSAVVRLEATTELRKNSGSTFPIGRFHLPAGLRRLAELEESRANRQAAVRYYRRLLVLWSDADPELGHQVESARRSLARLTGAEAS